MTMASETRVGQGLGLRRLAMAAAGAVLLLVVTLAGPASAHSSSVYLKWTFWNRGHGGVTASHHYAYACDDRADGNAIYTDFFYSGGKGRVYAPFDGDCKQIQVGPYITKYQVCMVLPNMPDPCNERSA